MPDYDEDELELLNDVFYPHSEESYLDADEPVERLVADRSETDPVFGARLCARIQQALDQADGEEAALMRNVQMFVGVPVGSTLHQWYRYLLRLIPELVAWPRDFMSPDDLIEGTQLPRTSVFTDLPTANAACTKVLRAHEAQFRAWAADESSSYRLHLYAELGQQVGTVGLQHQGLLVGEPQPATAAVVLMRKHHETRQPFIAASYPEFSFDVTARSRFPDLCLLFGGYFGQDYKVLDGHGWSVELNVNSTVPPPIKERITKQLVELLTEPDDVLGLSVDALGSYVRPTKMRRWVTGLHRRMTTVDWSTPAPSTLKVVRSFRRE